MFLDGVIQWLIFTSRAGTVDMRGSTDSVNQIKPNTHHSGNVYVRTVVVQKCVWERDREESDELERKWGVYVIWLETLVVSHQR